MTGAGDAAGLLGGAVLALGCVPLLAGEAATAVRAATAQAVVLALALAGRAVSDAAWGELAGALALAALGLGALPRLLRGGTAGARGAGRWRRAAAGLGLAVLGAAAAHGAALLQEAALRDTLGLALPTTLLGLLAASLRRAAAVRGAAIASALHGVVLAALALPDGGAGPAVFVAAPAVAMLVVAALAWEPAGTAPAAEPAWAAPARGVAGADGRTGLAGPGAAGSPAAGPMGRTDSRIGPGA